MGDLTTSELTLLVCRGTVELFILSCKAFSGRRVITPPVSVFKARFTADLSPFEPGPEASRSGRSFAFQP
jgi:hypothetical protein